MTLHTLHQEQFLPITAEDAWQFFSSPANLNELTPDDIGFQITSPHSAKLFEGQIITYRIKIAPWIRVKWVTEIKCVEAGRSFIDEQRFGPYKFWHHRHQFEPVHGGVMMTDWVNYALPFGIFGAIAHRAFVRRKLESIFNFRKKALIERFGNV
ncbi:MAG: SRPBCC family protein [Gloeobacteraceae cyanobacterium ES-bin-144]|nr:SRPBCC family protein [Verrucomicrobiales bacterium]